MIQRKQIFKTFKGKRVLITGHTGFKGSWLSVIMHELGAKVYGVSIDDFGIKSHYNSVKNIFIEDRRLDIRDSKSLIEFITGVRPDFIFHLAAQPIVKDSYTDPSYTFTTNAIGTMNVLEYLRQCERRVIGVFITSDKAYENVETYYGYREDDTLGGKDPYSASKACAELVIKSYHESFLKNSEVRLAVGRAGNVIGGGDWANFRIVPDAIRSWIKNESLILRNPRATRPWQHVLEPLFGYVLLAIHLDQEEKIDGESFNFGPNASQNADVESIVSMLSTYWPEKAEYSAQVDKTAVYESGLLKLNCDKALHFLSWKPIWDLDTTIKKTAEWYAQARDEKIIYQITTGQINEYLNKFLKDE